MAVRTCIHPNCDAPLKRFQVACGRHWYALPSELRDRFSNARKRGESAVGAVVVDAQAYFESRMIGEHEIATCRAEGCGADIVFLTAYDYFRNTEYAIPVNADTVDAADVDFDKTKHVRHFTTCKDPDSVRRKRDE